MRIWHILWWETTRRWWFGIPSHWRTEILNLLAGLIIFTPIFIVLMILGVL